MSSRIVVLDKFSFITILHLYNFRNCTIINFGEEVSVYLKLFLSFIFRIKITTPSFFLGDIKSDDSESLALKVRKRSNVEAINLAERIINRHELLIKVSSDFDNKSLIIGYSRIIALELEPVLNVIFLSQYLFNVPGPSFLIEKPKSFSQDFITETFNYNFYFYRNPFLEAFKFVKSVVKSYTKEVIKYFIFLYKSILVVPELKVDQSILTGLEDTIRIESDLRNQLFWYNGDFKHDIICFNNSFLGTSKFGISEKLPENCEVLHFSDYVYFSRINARDSVFNELKILIKQLNGLLRNCNSSFDYSVLLYVRNLLQESIEMGSLILATNCKAVVSKEVQSTYFDAVQFCPKEIRPKTIGIQYSNMSMFSPFMVSGCDYFLVFSKFYIQFFRYSDFGPKRFIESGYVYNSVLLQTRRRADVFKMDNTHIKEKVVLGYFDESIQNSKWGFISEEHYFSDVILLSEFVIRNPNVVVIFKTQFMTNLPSKKYAKNRIFMAALETGRFIDYFHGRHRNEIYPSEVAHLCNICLSEKIGATAGLESYLAGCNTVLINSLGLKCEQDVFYLSEGNIEFRNLESFLIEFENSGFNYRIFGDWSRFVHNFNSGGDLKGEIYSLI